MVAKTHDIFRVTTRNQDVAVSLKSRIEEAKKLASIKTIGNISSDLELLEFFLNQLESSNTEKLNRSEQNINNIQSLIAKQLDVNATDNTTVVLKDKPLFINKRFISSAYVQKELGCSFVAIKQWFDNPDNQAMLNKHHDKHGISPNHNRLVAKAIIAGKI